MMLMINCLFYTPKTSALVVSQRLTPALCFSVVLYDIMADKHVTKGMVTLQF